MTRATRRQLDWTMRGGTIAAVLALPLLLPVSCSKAPGSSGPVTDGETRDMVELLRHQRTLVNPVEMRILVNDLRAAHFRREVDRLSTSNERLPARFALATELVNAGQLEQALLEIGQIEGEAKVHLGEEKWKQSSAPVLMLQGLAHLRQAELQNCCQSNGPDSCLLPIQGGGIHRQREGSTRAIECLEQALALNPGNLRARWLLNIAHMTLGSYPDRVPPAYLIPPSAFASEHPLKRFPNIARTSGVDVLGLAGGAILDDLDADGQLDLLISSIGFDTSLRYFRGSGRGTFEEQADTGVAGLTGGLNLIQADYDNDGLTDALVLRGGWMESEGRFPLSLLRNTGGGRFVDVTRAAGLLRYDPTQTATWLDYDADGWLDLFIGNESSTNSYHACQLFHSNRDGTFTETTHEAGVDYAGFVKGVVSGDYNNDGRPDIYVSVLGGDNLLYRNDGPQAGGGKAPAWRFANVAAAAGVTAPRASFGTFFFDYDNDGWQDLFVVGYTPAMAEDVAADYLGLPTKTERGRLYRNKGDGTFQDVTQVAKLDRVVPAMGINFGDLDNDGWLDFYAGTGNPDFSSLMPNRMFRNAEGRFFQDVTTAGNFGHLQKGHAICFGDIDGDGDEDIFANMGGAYLADTAYSALFENPGNDNRWIGLELRGTRSNRCAIGARIRVTAVMRSGGPRQLYRTVCSGGSFGASPLRQHVGLGDAIAISAIEVSWPVTGDSQRLSGLELDRWYRITEGKAEAEPLGSPRGPVAAAPGGGARSP